MDLSMLLFYGFMIDSFWNKMETKRPTFTHVILVVRSSMNFPMASILNKLEYILQLWDNFPNVSWEKIVFGTCMLYMYHDFAKNCWFLL